MHQAFPPLLVTSSRMAETFDNLYEKPDALVPIRLILAAFALGSSNTPCSGRGSWKFSMGTRQVHTWPSFGTASRNPPAETWKKTVGALAMSVKKPRGKRVSQEEETKTGINAKQFARGESQQPLL